jgi:hypothetical protein
MKTLMLFILILGMFLNVSADFRRKNTYQVISSHPHDMEELAPYIETVKKDGRLWIVKLKKKAPESIKKHLQLVSGREKSYIHFPSIIALTQFKMGNKITDLVEQVRKENIQDEVVRLASYQTRAVNTKDNQDAVKTVSDKLQSFGYEIKKICYAANACSVVADKKGSMFPDQVLMVMAHIDSVGAAYAGADDNASGTAVLLEMARVLKSYTNKKTLRFFITNGEESGMLGAAHYARLLANQNQISQIAFAINMDMVGYNSNGVVELETNPEFESLAKWYADIAAQYTNLKSKITLGAWGSDHVPFLRRGIGTILTIENWDTKTPCYHMECDTPETVNYDYAAEIGKLNVAAILNKDLI